MRATVGRIVHYVEGDPPLSAVDHNRAHRVAFVVVGDEGSGVVDLGLLLPADLAAGRHAGMLAWADSVIYDEDRGADSWHWPERDD